MQKAKHIQSRLEYGGIYSRRRFDRSRPRPVSSRHTLHLVLRSSKARGPWSFTKNRNRVRIQEILQKFSRRHGVQVVRLGIVGNHVHLHIKLAKTAVYKPFIRATTSAIAMAVTGASRWSNALKEGKFWDLRPYTRLVIGEKAKNTLNDYIEVNRLEGFGMTRREAQVAYFCNSS